ncbi:hypothetical protein MN032_03205 [Agromyces atrinae]|uniref:hypothetical protein n=1 Tax=Agromyces atrinae TaxID=592376 RepID=UPI001F55FAAA|nr:hypothetical protein [Agromyces atrinae]MCI2956691.1 hypothetical protein [Agromyces atrinae]
MLHSATSDRFDYSTLVGGDESPGLYWPNVSLEGSEAFGAQYLADVDSYRIGGNVPAEKLEAALDGHDYSFEFSAEAGRASR